MNQVRFQIGTPKGGSAARLAENSGASPLGSIRPQGGSAARDAEDRKRAEPTAARRGAAIGMRTQGGRVVTEEELRIASMTPHVAHAEASRQAGEVSAIRVGRIREGVESVPPAQRASATTTPVAERTSAESVPSHSLQTAAVRVKSLVQSLLSLGGSSSKS